MKKSILHVFFLCLLIFLGSCSETMDLPGSGSGQNAGINRDPNKFVRISPDWSFASLGLQTPLDIFPGANGRMYIADSAAAAIRVIRPSGEAEGGIFDTLASLDLNPLAVCMDSRLNIYYCDGNDKIYVWPQFAASVGVKGIVSKRSFRDAATIRELDPLEGLALKLPAIPGSEVIDSTDFARIDSILAPHVFYDSKTSANRLGIFDPVSGENMKGNPVYATLSKSLSALATGQANSRAIYAMDSRNNQLLKIRLLPTLLLQLKNGQFAWQYQGILESFVASAGTGAGTVSQPLAMCSDNGGNIYYTQTGDFFSVHKLASGVYRSDFSVAEDDIMRLGEFGYARDICVALDGNVFVLDTLDHDVKMYRHDGAFLKSLAVREEWLRISDSLFFGDSLVLRDTLVLQQYPDLLKRPMALCYYDDVLYVLDNGNQRILRFTKVDDVIIRNPDREE